MTPVFVNTRVAIIIPSFRDVEFLRGCIDSVWEHTVVPFNIIVVSSDPDEETKTYLKECASGGWIVAHCPYKRLWFTEACNQGLRLAMAVETPPFTHLLLLNSDTYVLPMALEQMLADMYELDCGIMGCKTLTGDGKIDHAGAFGLGFHYGIRRGNSGYFEPRVCRPGKEWVTGAVFLVRRDVLETVGLLDEVQNPHIGSDRAYCQSVRAAGFRVGYSPSTIYHFTLSHQKEGHDGSQGR